ncbi:hypothetical protein QU38_01095, partial [Staphylococcus aureus]
PGTHQRRARGRSALGLPDAVLRGSAAAPDDLRRSQPGGSRAAGRGASRTRRAQGGAGRAAARAAAAAAGAGDPQRSGSARPAAGRGHDPGQAARRDRRHLRAARKPGADRSVRQLAHPGYQCAGSDGGGGPRGLPEEPV